MAWSTNPIPARRRIPSPARAGLAIGFAAVPLLVLASFGTAHGFQQAAQAADAACGAQSGAGRAATSVLYVAATSARVRQQPRADSATQATLPIGTALQVECGMHAWLRVRGMGEAPATGWVRADLLQAEPPMLDALVAAHARAPAGERKGLAERAVALAPFDARSHQLMIDTLTARRDRKGARQAIALRDRLVNPQGERLGREPWTLFAVEDGLVNAVAIVENVSGTIGFRDASTWSPAGTDANTSPYLLRHRALHFYRRGGTDGVVQVLEAPSAEAIGFFAPVRRPPAATRDPVLDGLASNQVVTTVQASPAAVPSRAERGAIDRELRTALKRGGVPARTISALLAAPADAESGSVQRHALPASGKPILLATAHWRMPARGADADPPLLDVVLLMEADGKGTYRVTHRLVQETVGENLAHHVFIDHLDVDQDGVAELVFRVGSHEGSDYEIWRRQAEGWKQVFKGAYTGV